MWWRIVRGNEAAQQLQSCEHPKTSRLLSYINESKGNPILEYLMKSCLTFAKARKTLANVLRFTNSTRLKVKKRHHFTEELRESKLWLFKWSYWTINLYTVDEKLIPASDEQGVLCAHGRLENIGSLPDEMHNPIILPRSSINTLETPLLKASTLQLQKSHLWIKQAFLDRGCAKYGQTSNW